MSEKPFVCSYTFNGAQWGVEIYATDFADASRRLRAIGTTGTVDGELHAKIKVMPNWLARFFGWA